jgi:hypothetical protein
VEIGEQLCGRKEFWRVASLPPANRSCVHQPSAPGKSDNNQLAMTQSDNQIFGGVCLQVVNVDVVRSPTAPSPLDPRIDATNQMAIGAFDGIGRFPCGTTTHRAVLVWRRASAAMK